jgi:MFS transporter, CP family, cyanate transporter
MRSPGPAMLVVLGGVAAALHVGKLPPALPALRDTLGVTLLQGGFLLSLVQLAGMSLGLAVGLAADGLGLKRTMVAGLLTLSAASILGSWARSGDELMALRAVEGVGFLLASMPAPGLIRRLVEPAQVQSTLGLWGAYMPFGTAVAFLAGPHVIAAAGWRPWWWLLGAISLSMTAWLWWALPHDPPYAAVAPRDHKSPDAWRSRLGRTLRARGPWLVALAFAMYSGQWLAVIGFLPTVYAEAGVSPGIAAIATALAAAINMAGNIASGLLLRRRFAAHHLLYCGFAAMAVGAFCAFAPIWQGTDPTLAAGATYAAVLMFSAVGGLIPGTLFSLAVALAPDERTISTTVGWMQQWSSLGQVAGPPLVAWIATQAGGWQWSWVVTGTLAACGIALAAMLALQASHANVSRHAPLKSAND